MVESVLRRGKHPTTRRSNLGLHKVETSNSSAAQEAASSELLSVRATARERWAEAEPEQGSRCGPIVFYPTDPRRKFRGSVGVEPELGQAPRLPHGENFLWRTNPAQSPGQLLTTGTGAKADVWLTDDILPLPPVARTNKMPEKPSPSHCWRPRGKHADGMVSLPTSLTRRVGHGNRAACAVAVCSAPVGPTRTANHGLCVLCCCSRPSEFAFIGWNDGEARTPVCHAMPIGIIRCFLLVAGQGLLNELPLADAERSGTTSDLLHFTSYQMTPRRLPDKVPTCHLGYVARPGQTLGAEQRLPRSF